MTTTLTPRLIVTDAAKAIDFYTRALGAVEASRHHGPDGEIVHAELVMAGVSFTLKDETPGTTDLGPASFGGTPVLLQLTSTTSTRRAPPWRTQARR